MAGSYNHAVAQESDGQLYCNEDFVRMVENLGDAYETVEEMYGMIWWLAGHAALLDTSNGPDRTTEARAELVEQARTHYRDGLQISPGTDGRLPEDDV